MRVVLFDIDGTLLLTGRAGQFAMEEIAGSEVLPERSFAGRTDRSIISDQMMRMGIAATPANFDDFCQRFLHSLSAQLHRREGQVLPGVRRLLDRLQQRPDVTVGLLTGNLRQAAQLKLIHYRLDHYFYGPNGPLGAFGDVHLDRDDVAREALDALRRHLAASIAGEDVWVIGDTPLDIRCARAISARVLAVATGGYSVEELQREQPDHTVANLDQIDGWLPSFLADVT